MEEISMLAKRFFVVSTSVFVLLMIILAFGDLDFSISQAIVNEQSAFAKFFNMFGELPAIGGLTVAITILYRGRNKDIRWKNITSSIITVFFIILTSALTYFNILRYIFHEEIEDITTTAYVIIFVLAITQSILAIVWANKNGEYMRDLRKHAWFIIVMVVSVITIVGVVKGAWARPRMRSIINGDNEFSYWYEINGPTSDNELKSFPSGHTANAWITLPLVVLIPYEKSAKLKWWIAFAVLWGSMVALSRVIFGAHFLSDVLVGSYITILLFYVGYGLVFRNKTIT